MAVEDKYTNTEVAAGKLANPALTQGAKVVAMVASFEVAALDDDGSVYRVIKGLSPTLIPISLLVYNDAIAGATDYDLGLYESDLGPVVDATVFMDSEDINAGNGITSPANGLANVDVANLGKKIYEHAGETIKNHKASYDLAFTANTVGTAAGTITLIGIFIEG